MRPQSPRHTNQKRLSVTLLLAICVLATCFVQGAGAFAPMLIALLALLTGLKSGSGKLLGFRRPTSWTQTLLLGAGIGIGLQVIFHTLVDPLLEIVTGTTLDLSHMQTMEGDPGKLVVWLLIGWLIGGVLEELSFRGYIITRTQHLLGENTLGTAVAVTLSVVPFGIAHLYQDWAGVLSTGLMGLILAVIYLRTNRDLILAMLVHGFNNTAGLIIIYLGSVDSYRLL